MHRRWPWLGRVGLVVTAFFYLAACALVLGDHLSGEADHTSMAQVAVTSAVVALLIGAAVATRRRHRERVAGGVPGPWLVGLSLRRGWTRAHTVTAAGGALVAAGAGAFLTTPLGDVPDVAKYAHNLVLLVLVAGLTVWATMRSEDEARQSPRQSAIW